MDILIFILENKRKTDWKLCSNIFILFLIEMFSIAFLWRTLIELKLITVSEESYIDTKFAKVSSLMLSDLTCCILYENLKQKNIKVNYIFIINDTKTDN